MRVHVAVTMAVTVRVRREERRGDTANTAHIPLRPQVRSGGHWKRVHLTGGSRRARRVERCGLLLFFGYNYVCSLGWCRRRLSAVDKYFTRGALWRHKFVRDGGLDGGDIRGPFGPEGFVLQ